jgi:hypothetical protein
MRQFMPDLPPKDRQRLLTENADRIEETTYFKPLSQDELDLRREKLTDNAILLSEFEDEKKDIMDTFKSKMKPLVDENKVIMEDVKRKQAEVTGKLFHMANHEEGLMETFDENGEFVSSRRLRPDEKQATIFTSLSKAQ